MTSTTARPTASSTSAPLEKSYFEQQREAMLREIGVVRALHYFNYSTTKWSRVDETLKSFEHVLANINKLNRSLEGVIAVGVPFCVLSSVEPIFDILM